MPTIWTKYHDYVAQAAGMVSVQAECSLDAAFALMVERAQQHGGTLDEVAAAVVDRRMRFSPDAI